jgi:hypothetical protein
MKLFKSIIFFLTVPLLGFSQKKKELVSINFFGIDIKKGDTLKLGSGSGNNGDFSLIIVKPDLLAPVAIPINSGWANKKFIVDSIYELKDDLNKSYYMMIKNGKVSRYMVTDIELAVKKKELESVNSQSFIPK